MKLILASASPRRAALLKQAGISFEVIPPRVDESRSALEDPWSLVKSLALAKAYAVAGETPSGLILAADTTVYCRGRILGKPGSALEARKMLTLLSGRKHIVVTGLALIQSPRGRVLYGCSTTRVFFRKLDRTLIDAYVASGEPRDKAGAYAIQGRAALFVERLEGCYFNVVGLPLGLLLAFFQAWQLRPWPLQGGRKPKKDMV